MLDFICGFSAVNLGQCHPRILQAQIESAQKRAFQNHLTTHQTIEC